MFSFTLLSSLCKTSRIHLSTWFFPEFDVLCLQGRTNLAAVTLEAEREQNSSKAGYFVHPGAPEGCHLFLLLRILLAKLTAFFWPWLGHLDSGKSFIFFPFLLDRKCILSPNNSVACVLIWRKLLFFLSLGDKGKFWLEWSVLKAERKQSLRHRNRTSNIFPFAKQHMAGKERRHPSPTEADGEGATDFHGMRDPPEEPKLTGLPAISMTIGYVCSCSSLQFQQTGRMPSVQGCAKPRSKWGSLPHRSWNQSLWLT